MDALSWGVWLHAIGSCVWMDALSRGDWKYALTTGG